MVLQISFFVLLSRHCALAAPPGTSFIIQHVLPRLSVGEVLRLDRIGARCARAVVAPAHHRHREGLAVEGQLVVAQLDAHPLRRGVVERRRDVVPGLGRRKKNRPSNCSPREIRRAGTR